MAVQGWKTRSNGDIELNPLTGYAIATFPMTGAVRVQYARSDQELMSGKHQALQSGMTAPQAREFAQALLRMAEAIEKQPLGTQQ